MGTHNYRMEIRKFLKKDENPGIKALEFNRIKENSTADIGNFCTYSYGTFLRDMSCRESVCYRFQELHRERSKIKECDFVVGLRSYGEMYNTTARCIRKISRELGVKYSELVEIVSKFFSATFELDLIIRSGFLTRKKANLSPGGKTRTFRKGDKTTLTWMLGYYDVYIESWDNFHGSNIDVKISAILALLREPDIVEGIIYGEITDMNSLIKSIVRLSVSRFNKDKSNRYLCAVAVGGILTVDNLKMSMLDFLKSPLNDDGSDWYSMLNLAVFCQTIASIKSNAYICGGSGPADYGRRQSELYEKVLKTYVEKKQLSELRDYAKFNGMDSLRNRLTAVLD